MNTTRQSAYALAGAQALLGLATIVRAPEVAPQPWLGLSRTAMTRIVRVLGARQLVQAAAMARVGTPAAVLLGSAVDATHALSMVPVAALPGPYRRASAVSAGLAGALALAEFLAARRAG